MEIAKSDLLIQNLLSQLKTQKKTITNKYKKFSNKCQFKSLFSRHC